MEPPRVAPKYGRGGGLSSPACVGVAPHEKPGEDNPSPLPYSGDFRRSNYWMHQLSMITISFFYDEQERQRISRQEQEFADFPFFDFPFADFPFPFSFPFPFPFEEDVAVAACVGAVVGVGS